MKYTLENWYTGKLSLHLLSTVIIKVTIIYNLPKSDHYELVWESLTNNDTEGYVSAPDAYATTSQ